MLSRKTEKEEKKNRFLTYIFYTNFDVCFFAIRLDDGGKIMSSNLVVAASSYFVCVDL